MKKIAILLLFIGSGSFAQSVNDYQYVVVPSKFTFSNKKDEFRLNTLTKMLLIKYGFKAYLDSEQLPDEVADSNCKKLYADVESASGMLTTRVRVTLKDCKNKILFTSDQGSSREKDFSKAYNLAVREAFESFSALQYVYTPNAAVATAISKVEPENRATSTSATLFAQPVANGFQLVDSTPKVVMKIFKTSDANRFSAVKGELHGDLIAKNGEWFFEYYQNDQLVSEKIAVKF